MDAMSRIAERLIEEAIARGDWADYPGKGEPLELEDLSRIDPELRASYMLLKGHGFVSEEHELCGQLVSVHTLLAACRDAEERERLTSEQRRLRLRFSILLEQRGVPIEVIEQLARALEARSE
jgi:hypothetical protein